MLLIVVVLAGLYLPAVRLSAAVLPQDHEYQAVLRDYMAKLTEEDLAVELEDVRFEEDWMETDEDMHRLWLLFMRYDRTSPYSSFRPLPGIEGIRLSPENFLLSTIEGDEGIMMDVANTLPGDTAWWSAWDYRGNPYYGSRALRLRAFVTVAVDLIMLDNLHESGTHWVHHGRRADYLGGTMIWLSYVYSIVRDDLPEEVRTAYETGLLKLLDRLDRWGPTGVNDNMDMKGVSAVAYLAEVLGEGEAADRARAYAERALGRIVHPAGIIRDAGGLEASYSGIALQYLVKATNPVRWPLLVDTLDRMSRLKSYMTLPEPDGRIFGPSNFSLRTPAGYPHDQHSTFQRDIGAAMESYHALYLMFGWRRGVRRNAWAAPGRSQMLAEILDGIDHANSRMTPSGEEVTQWVRRHWGSAVNNSPHDNYQPGFYERLRDLYETDDPLTRPPFAREDYHFIHAFPDPEMEDVSDNDRHTFLIVRFEDYGAIFDAAPLTWHSIKSLGGLSGGTLSAFWTPDAGSVVLGRTGGRGGIHHDWDDWRILPVHALSGVTPEGQAFTSARLDRKAAEVEFILEDETASAVISGPIGVQHDGGRTVQGNCITGLVEYRRRFRFDKQGVEVETELVSDGSDDVAELYEIIPLFLGDARDPDDLPPHRVEFYAEGEWQDAGSEFVDGVTGVRVQRFNGGALIAFEKPQRLGMAPERFQTTYMSRAVLHNVMIDLLDSGGQPAALPSVSVRYRILPSMDGEMLTNGELFGGKRRADQAARSPAEWRRAVIGALSKEEAGLALLGDIMAEGGMDVTVRRTAAAALPQFGQQAASTLSAAFKDADDEVRRFALNGLHRISVLTDEMLQKALNDEALTVRRAAVDLVNLPERWDFFPDPMTSDMPVVQLMGESRLSLSGPREAALFVSPTGEDRAQGAVVAPHPALSPQGAFSIEILFRLVPESMGRSGYIIDKMGIPYEHRQGRRDYYLRLVSTGKDTHRIDAVLGFGEEGMSAYSTEAVRFDPGRWYSLVFHYDGRGGGEILLDGEFAGGGRHPGRESIVPGDFRLAIGDRATSRHSPFYGYIGAVRIRSTN